MLRRSQELSDEPRAARRRLGADLRRVRRALGLSQGAVARAVGCHQTRISEAEQGRVGPGELRKILRVVTRLKPAPAAARRQRRWWKRP
ncbi:MAG: helix-turn-helix domain-containing protein [Burkholderiales bacterium]